MKHSRYVPLSAMLLAAGLIAPAYAQDAADAQTAPDAATDAAASSDPAVDAGSTDAAADSSATSDTTTSDTMSADTGTVDTGASDASASDASTSDASASDTSDSSAGDTTDASVSSEPAAEPPPPRKPFYVYAGADYAFLRTSLSKDSLKTALGGDEFDSDFYRVRVGTRLLRSIGIEAHFGVKNDDGKDPGKVETNQMYGVYLVPTGNLFRFLEVSAPVGYSHLRLENGNGKVDFDSLSFALNFEVPVYVNPDSRLPDVRIGGGGVVYYAEREARTYGYHAGLRLDFKI